MFTREWVSDLRRVRERHPELPRVALVHQGSVEQGRELLAKRWPGALAISDPERRLYGAFAVKRGKLLELLGPQTWVAGFRALFKGHFVGKPVGDPLVLPGMFLAHGNRVLWSHDFRHAGDLPSEADLVAAGALVERAQASDAEAQQLSA